MRCAQRWSGRATTFTVASQQLVFLPLRHGGLGFRSWANTADAAYVSAYAHAASLLPAYYPTLLHTLPPLTALIGQPTAATPPPAADALQAYAALLLSPHRSLPPSPQPHGQPDTYSIAFARKPMTAIALTSSRAYAPATRPTIPPILASSPPTSPTLPTHIG